MKDMNWINIAESTTATLIAGWVTALAGGIYAAVKVKPTRCKNGDNQNGVLNVKALAMSPEKIIKC